MGYNFEGRETDDFRNVIEVILYQEQSSEYQRIYCSHVITHNEHIILYRYINKEHISKLIVHYKHISKMDTEFINDKMRKLVALKYSIKFNKKFLFDRDVEVRLWDLEF